MNNAYTNKIVEFHILQSFPVTCLNRDDVGAPKTAIVGGTTRARVSSQSWKRQVRLKMQDFGIKLAVRTKKIEELLKKACLDLGADEGKADECAQAMAKQLSDDTLLFFSQTEALAFAEYAKDKEFEPKELKVRELARVSKKALNPAIDGLDIALFGRMVAKAPEMQVEAAASFAHAISTHRVTNEVEFFTAVDDLQDAAGSSHMGSLEFNSATYYRYISLDLGQLAQSFENTEDLKVAVAAFIKALYVAVPSARQTTQSGASPWEFARVYVRQGQRLQVPFETAVKASDGGFLQASIISLCDYLDKKEKLSGSLFGKIGMYEWGNEENYSIDQLIEDIKQHL